MIGCTREAPFAGLTRTGAGGPEGGGVGVGVRRPLADVALIQNRNSVAVNTEKAFVVNIGVFIHVVSACRAIPFDQSRWPNND